MKKKKNEYHVLSLGGSLVAPEEGVDWRYLKKLRALLLRQIKRGHKFFIVVGGGSVCRQYQRAAVKVVPLSDIDLDWLGIYSTRLNAHFLRTILHDVASPEIIISPRKQVRLKKPVAIASGWKPGHSTDYDAVALAKIYGVQNIINLSNIDYVYDKDPKQYKDAKKIEKISWADFRKIVGDKWTPGLNKPFDPAASRLAEKLKFKVVIMNGRKLGEFKKCLDGKMFRGTTVG